MTIEEQKNETTNPIIATPSKTNAEAVMQLWEHGVPFYVRKISTSNAQGLETKIKQELETECAGITDRPATLIANDLPYHTYGGAWKEQSGFLIAPTTQISALYKMHCLSMRRSSDSTDYSDVGGKPYLTLKSFMQKLYEDKYRLITKEIPAVSTRYIAAQFQQQNLLGFQTTDERDEALKLFIKGFIRKDDPKITALIFEQVISKYGDDLLANYLENPKHRIWYTPNRKMRDRRNQWDEKTHLAPNESLLKVRSLAHRLDKTAVDTYQNEQTTQEDIELQLQLANATGDIVGVFYDPNSIQNAFRLWTELSKQQGADALIFTYDPVNGLALKSSDCFKLMLAINKHPKLESLVEIFKNYDPNLITEQLCFSYQNGTLSAHAIITTMGYTPTMMAALWLAHPDFMKKMMTAKHPNGASQISELNSRVVKADYHHYLNLLIFADAETMEKVLGSESDFIALLETPNAPLEPLLACFKKCSPAYIERVVRSHASKIGRFWAYEGFSSAIENCSSELIEHLLTTPNEKSKTLLEDAMAPHKDLALYLKALGKCKPEMVWRVLCEAGEKGETILELAAKEDAGKFTDVITVLTRADPNFLGKALNLKNKDGRSVKVHLGNEQLKTVIAKASAHAYLLHGADIPASMKRSINKRFDDYYIQREFFNELINCDIDSFLHFVQERLEQEKQTRKSWFTRTSSFSEDLINHFTHNPGSDHLQKLFSEHPEKLVTLAQIIQSTTPGNMVNFYENMFGRYLRKSNGNVYRKDANLVRELRNINPKAYAHAMLAMSDQGVKSYLAMYDAILLETNQKMADKTMSKNDLIFVLETVMAAAVNSKTFFSRVFHRDNNHDLFAKQLSALIADLGEEQELSPEQNRFLKVIFDDYKRKKNNAVLDIGKALQMFAADDPNDLDRHYEDYKMYSKIMRKTGPVDLDAATNFIFPKTTNIDKDEIRQHLEINYGIPHRKRGCFGR